MLPSIASALAGAAALTFAGYHTMSPGSQLYGRTFFRESEASDRLALTFDDGPSDPHTLRLLDVLARHQVRATFFMIGRHVARHPQIARAVAQAGHVIGNHTYSHPLLTLKSRTAVWQEIEACRQALLDAAGEPSRLFRPPYGGRRPGVLREVRNQGYDPVMWSVSGNDWRTQEASAIATLVRKQICGGDVVLLHDGGPQAGMDRSGTVEAVNQLIPQLRDKGLTLATVPEMMPAG